MTSLKKENNTKKPKHTGSVLRNRKNGENYKLKKERLSNKSVKELKKNTQSICPL